MIGISFVTSSSSGISQIELVRVTVDGERLRTLCDESVVRSRKRLCVGNIGPTLSPSFQSSSWFGNQCEVYWSLPRWLIRLRTRNSMWFWESDVSWVIMTIISCQLKTSLRTTFVFKLAFSRVMLLRSCGSLTVTTRLSEFSHV